MIQNNGYPGLYIVFEGIIGTGKSTQIKLLQERLGGWQGVVFTREPGGTLYAERIREIVKNRKLAPLDETKLFAEARKHTIEEVILPALKEGKLVIADRSIISSLAYQGFGGKVTFNKVWQINRKLIPEIPMPDCVVYLELPIYLAKSRSEASGNDKFDKEDLSFWLDVLTGYENALTALQREHRGIKLIKVYDQHGKNKPAEIQEKILSELWPFVEKWKRTKEGRIVREQEA